MSRSIKRTGAAAAGIILSIVFIFSGIRWSLTGPETAGKTFAEEPGAFELLEETLGNQESEAEYEGFIFTVTDDAADEAADVLEEALSDGTIEKVEFSENTYTVQDPDDIKEILNEDQVEVIEPDYRVYMWGDVPEEGVTPDSALAPNDKYYETYQYNLRDLNVPAIWEYGIEGQDFDSGVDMNSNGAGDDDDIVVAVIDSGLKDGHEDIDWDRVVTGISFADGTTEDNTDDTDGHGTFVTGIIAAIKDNVVGTAGILQRVKVMPIRVFNGENASDSVIVNGINYAAQQKELFDSSNGKEGTNICVINMSLGSSGTSSAMDTACQRAMAAGIIVVCAAGNDGNTTASYPAQYSMGVGSTNSSKTVSSYSQRLSSYNGSTYANKVWVAAPGEGITSLYCENTKSYAQMSGTSFSSPEVAALAAVCKSLKNDMAQEEFMQLLKDTSDYKTGSSGNIGGQDVEYGWGLVNFKSTVDALISQQFGEQTGESVLTVSVQNEAGTLILQPFVNIYEISAEDGSEVKGSEIKANADGTWTLQKGKRYFYAAHAEKYDYKEETFAVLTSERTLTITLKGKAYPVAFEIVNTAGEKVVSASLTVRSINGVAFEMNDDGQFMLRNGNYTYSIEADSYFDTDGTFTIDDILENMDNGKVISIVIRGDCDVCSMQLRVMGDSEDGDITRQATIELSDGDGNEITPYKDGKYKLDQGTYEYAVYHDEYKTVKGSITIARADIGTDAVQNIAMNGKLYTVTFHIFPLSSDPDVLIYDDHAEVYERQAGRKSADYRNYRLTEGKYYFFIKDSSKGTYKGTFTLSDATVYTSGLSIGTASIIQKSGKRDIRIDMQNNSPNTVFTDNTDIPDLDDLEPGAEQGETGHVHKYISKITKEPSCTEAGELTWTCIAGDDSYTEEIQKLAHQFDEDGVCTVCGIHDYETYDDEDWLTLNLTDASGQETTRMVALLQMLPYETVKTYTMINSYYGTSTSFTVYGITFESFIEHFVGPSKCVSEIYITAMTDDYDLTLDREMMEDAMIAWYTINNSSGEQRTGSVENNMRIAINNGMTNDWMFGPDTFYISYGSHKYGKGTVSEPSCTADGYTEYVCSECGESYHDNVIPAKGHVFDSSKDVITEPTCLTKGFTSHLCEVCGETVMDTYTDAGHDWGEWEVTRKATETEDGEEERVCRRDTSHKETRAIPKTGSGETDKSDPTVKPSEPAKDDEKTAPEESAATPSESSAQPVNPSAEPAETGTMFSDVADDSNIYKPVRWAVNSGIIKGFSDGTFRPEDSCTREQFAIMMWRFAGKPDADINAANKFSDIDYFSNNTSRKAVAWAVEEGIIKGFSDGHFGPQETVTRRQVVVMLWRWADRPAASQTADFSDVSSSETTYSAIQWGAEAGLVKGYSDGTFRPEDDCQRQHIVIFLYRYAREVLGEDVSR